LEDEGDMQRIRESVVQSPTAIGLVLFLVLIAMAPGVSAEDKAEKHIDAVNGVAHLSLPGTPVRQTFLQEHRGKQYLYIQQASQHGFTVVDVSKGYRPAVVKRITFPDSVTRERLQMVGAGLAIAEGLDPVPGNVAMNLRREREAEHSAGTWATVGPRVS
jgi:hypothetical protein